MTNSQPKNFHPCILIPVYNHWLSLRDVVSNLSDRKLEVLLVDDGSNQTCRDVLESLANELPSVHLITRAQNGGKGAAVKDGLVAAHQLGFTHALQIDADGQHNIHDVGKFLDAALAHPSALIVGYPLYDDTIPKVRFYFRYLSHVLVWINTLSTNIVDSMCGFRVYPVALSCDLIKTVRIGNHMDFDIEFIVRWYWAGHPMEHLETRVTYPEDGVSHFRMLQDNCLITLMHGRLFLGMLIRIPQLLLRKFSSDGRP